MKAPRDAGEAPRYVFVQRPRCPRCGADRPKTTRSLRDQGDGSTLRYARCRSCGCAFRVVVE